MLITYANSLEPDQAWQNVGPDLDPDCLTLMVFLKDFFERVDLEKNQLTTKTHTKLPRRQRVKSRFLYLEFYFQVLQTLTSLETSGVWSGWATSTSFLRTMQYLLVPLCCVL